MGALERWLGALPLDRFREEYLTIAPLASAGGGADDVGLFDGSVLERVLTAPTPPDTLVVTRGQLLPLPAPRSAAAVRELLDAGIGLAMRRGERSDRSLAALLDDLVCTVPGVGMVQLFVTPRRSHGFGWHYDDEDVFILQTRGVKDYYFRANTSTADEPAGAAGFARFREETSPLMTACLVPGDFLYIPARWWHMGVAHDESMSISIGILTGGRK